MTDGNLQLLGIGRSLVLADKFLECQTQLVLPPKGRAVRQGDFQPLSGQATSALANWLPTNVLCRYDFSVDIDDQLVLLIQVVDPQG